MAPGRIAVVGSLNLDHLVEVDRLPAPGETRHGLRVTEQPGGKGANQAVAAARLGGRVAMLGRVGDDPAGATLLEALTAARIDVEAVEAVADQRTGAAYVTVGREDAENQIVVLAHANGTLDAAGVEAAAGLLEDAAVTLVVLEIPLAAAARAADLARGTVVLNAAPAQALTAPLLAQVDVLVVNRGELAVVAGAPADDDPVALARGLGVPAVLVTLGAEGVVAVVGDETWRVGAHAVDAVDTTGAGDAFCGGLAEALARGASLREAVTWANAVGALATTAPGAQDGLPTAEAVRELLAAG